MGFECLTIDCAVKENIFWTETVSDTLNSFLAVFARAQDQEDSG